MSLRLFPATLKQANEMVAKLHRHHKPVIGHRFSIGCEDANGNEHGMAIVGRPVARMTDQNRVAEVTRLVTDGTPHVCSMLYAACARAADAMGYNIIQTAILENELGTSLKAAGWHFDHMTKADTWVRKCRPNRRTDQPMCAKAIWHKHLTNQEATQ